MSAVTAWDIPSAPLSARPRRRHLSVVRDVPVCREPASRTRLTDRGRLVLLVAALVAAAGLALASAAAFSGSASHGVSVQQGQTLSDIARAQLPGVPVSEAVVQIQLANGLNSLQISNGQHLEIPSR